MRDAQLGRGVHRVARLRNGRRGATSANAPGCDTLRRRLLQALALTATGAALAQSPAAARRIGWLTLNGPEVGSRSLREVSRRLARRHALGTQLVIEPRFAEGRAERLPELARELVGLQPALVVASAGNLTTQALMAATRSIPIVMLGANRPVEAGLVASLARPGGNVTGTTFHPTGASGKMLETLTVAVPGLSRVTVLWHPESAAAAVTRPVLQRSASALGITLTEVAVRQPGDFQLRALQESRPQAVYVSNAMHPLFPQVLRFCRQHRVASIGGLREFADAGGLLAYQPDMAEMFDNVAECIEALLEGASPATLPVRESTRLQLVLNRRTAEALGLTPSPELLLLADEVIS